MSTLDARRTYADGSILFAADLDALVDDIETFVNTTKINDDNIQNAGITASDKLIDATITAGKIASNAVTSAKIIDAAVTTAKINDLAVTTGKINDLAVTEGKIASTAVTAGKIGSSAVTTAKINDLAVTTAKINDSAVTTAKINDGAVTQAKRAALGQDLSSSSGSFTTTSTSFTDVTNLSCSITTTGRPVFIGLINDASGTDAYISATNSTDQATSVEFKLLRGATSLGEHRLACQNTAAQGSDPQIRVPVSSIWHIDVPSAGTYTYKLQAKATGSDDTAGVVQAKLIVFEL